MTQLIFRRHRVPAIAPRQWSGIATLLAKGDPIQPHEVALVGGTNRTLARAVLLALAGDGLGELKMIVYHACDEAPVAYLPYTSSFPADGWVCPNCGYAVEQSELRFDTTCVLYGAVELVE